MERRVLIVEHNSEFALSMASVLKGVGYQTALAEDGNSALRELDKRHHDLVVLRAELPDQSGFVLSGQIKKSQSGQGIAILLLSSEVDRDGMAQHAKSPNGVEGYLSVPFEMKELVELVARLAPVAEAAATSDEDKEMDESLNSALDPEGRPKEQPAATPPPIRVPSPGGPPKLPKRERRSAMTEEDRAFLDRTFQSIADRKAELLAESRQLRRSPRREMLGTPEGKVQILREELKLREAQIARLSEIWTVRERELLSVEDRLHEKDVELQGLKMQVDDLLRRFNDAHQTLLLKEKEHGATVDELLLQKFATEKDLIEVVASKEKDINTLRREATAREEELSRRAGELESSRKEYEKLEKQLGVTTLEFEVKEQNLNHAIQTRDAELASVRGELEKTRAEFSQGVAERDRKISEWEKNFQEQSDELLNARQERDSTVRDLEARLGSAEAHAAQSEAEIQRLRAERVEFEQKAAAQVAEFEAQLTELRTQRDDLRVQRDGLAQTMTDRLGERDAKIAQLEQELAETNRRREHQEAELGSQIQRHVERIGELEGEVEAAQTHLADRESELQAQMAERERELQSVFATREQEFRDRLSAQEKHWQGEINSLNEAKQQVELTLNEKLASSEKQVQELTERKNTLGQQLDEVRSALGQREQRLEQLRVELEKTVQERAAREGELKSARNEIARVKSILKQTEEAKATLEKQLTAQLDEASEARRKLEEELAGERATLEQTRAQLTNEIAGLQSQLSEVKDYASDLNEQLSNTKHELGERVVEVTQLSSQLNQAEDARQNTEERLQTLSEESERRETLLQNDLAAKSKEFSDLQRRLVQVTQERQRQIEALTREVSVKTEQTKQAEAKLRVAVDESRRNEEELSQKLAAVSNELQSARESLGEQLQVAKSAHSKAINERDQLRATLTGQVQQAMAKAQELSSVLQQTRVESKRLQEDLQGKLGRAEVRVAQMTQEFQSRSAKADHESKEATQQLALRARKIQELETALEGARTAKIRIEKELTARIVAADSKFNESAGRLSAFVRERKEVEARHLRELEELNAKHKGELERRDAIKSQELARLQQSVLEKSKALKVVELELARYKNRAPGPAARPPMAPTAPGAATPSHTGGKPQTTAVSERASRQSNPPATSRQPPVQQPVRASNGNPAKPRQPVADPSPVNSPASPLGQEDAVSESTLVLQIEEDTADWSSVIDDLDK